MDLRCVELSEGLEKIDTGAFVYSGVEDIVLPASTRVVCAQAFRWCKRLRRVALNVGLKAFGTSGPFQGSQDRAEAFMEAMLKNITPPSTLGAAEPSVSEERGDAKRTESLEGRDALGEGLDFSNTIFRNWRAEEVALPTTLREISLDVFGNCDSLRAVLVAGGRPADVWKLVPEVVGAKSQ